MMPAARSAFTLIEVMVCLMVIALISGVVFVAGGGAIRKGKAASCAGRLHSFGLASSLYAVDHADFMPPQLWRRYKGQTSGVNGHIAALVPYGFRPEDTFCPLDPLAHRDIDSEASNINSLDTSYGGGHSFPQSILYDGLRYYQAMSYGMIDSPSVRIHRSDIWWLTDDKRKLLSGHGDSTNKLFYDGHIASKRLPILGPDGAWGR